MSSQLCSNRAAVNPLFCVESKLTNCAAVIPLFYQESKLKPVEVRDCRVRQDNRPFAKEFNSPVE